jgi:hypothetical protein
MPEGDVFRFAHRNIQDWLCAFELERMSAQQLRSALADEQRKVFPRHRAMLALLRQVHSEPEVKELIDRISGGVTFPSDALPITLQQSLDCVNRLEEIARGSPFPLRMYWDSDLSRLSVPGLCGELARRMRDEQRPPRVKELLLDIAFATEPLEPEIPQTVPAAVALVLDSGQPDGVREHALQLVCRLGGPAHLEQLEGPIATGQGSTEVELRLRAGLIRELLQRRMWTVARAAVYAPPPELSVVDARSMLLHMIAERMSLEDAREVVRNGQRIPAARGNHATLRQDLDPLFVACKKLLSAPELNEVDLLSLAQTTLVLVDTDHNLMEIAHEVAQRSRSAPCVRRFLYAHGIEAVCRDPQAASGLLRSLSRWGLRAEDLDWLLDQAESAWTDLSCVWEDAYRLGYAATEQGRSNPEGWRRLNALVERHAPGLPERFERDKQASEQALKRVEEEAMALKHQAPPPLALDALVGQILALKGKPPEDRMRKLAYACFIPELRPANVKGDWDGLSPEQQSRVLDACRRGLEKGTPTALPEGTTFPGSILAEAQAFLQVLSDPAQEGWLNSEGICLWLPTMLFNAQDRPEIIRACWDVDAKATLDVLQQGITRGLWSGLRYAHLAREIPVECWTPVLAEHVADCVRAEAAPVEARAALLEVLALRSPDHAHPIAAEWAALSEAAPGDAPHLRQMGLNCLLALEPETALPLVEADFQKHAGEALLGLSTLWSSFSEMRVTWTVWPVTLQERLGRMLLSAFPFAGDPVETGWGYQVTTAHELRWVRNQLIELLLSRDRPEDRAALANLAQLDAGLRPLLADRQARSEAGTVLRELLEAPSREPSALPLPEAVRLLDQARFRIIRNSDDLLAAVLEVLRVIEGDVASDLPMLYDRPDRRRKQDKPSAKGKSPPRERLEEDALQAYLRRRLLDLLPSRIVPPGQVLREDQVRYRRKLDLRVSAPCFGGTEAMVVIEVKWSDNPGTERDLEEQLGRKYLRDEGLTHGIYLVGWYGHWTRRGKKRKDPDELRRYLTDQADRYCRPAAPGEGLTVRPVVLGLEWRDPADEPSPSCGDQGQGASLPGDSL